MPSDGRKGITVKIDEELHAEVRKYLEDHNMTMSEFVTIAIQNELHPKEQMKENKNMENARTLAFQVPEGLFKRIKDYLKRNNMTQREFVIGLIETELERDMNERASMENSTEEIEKEQSIEYHDGDEIEEEDNAEIVENDFEADIEERNEESEVSRCVQNESDIEDVQDEESEDVLEDEFESDEAETDDIRYESDEEEAINGRELDNEETEYENAEVYMGM